MDHTWQVFSTFSKKNIYPDRICAVLPYSISARLVLANQAFQKFKSISHNLKHTEYFFIVQMACEPVVTWTMDMMQAATSCFKHRQEHGLRLIALGSRV